MAPLARRAGTALVGLVAGLLFAAGLTLGGMTDPQVVQSFLRLDANWNPRLAAVMGGAVLVHLPLLRLLTQRQSRPWFWPRFELPTRRDLSPELIGGAALFGFGWGLAGYCPGPALTAAGAGSAEALIVVGGVVAGMQAHRIWEALRSPAPA
jgi:hypothetical protein